MNVLRYNVRHGSVFGLVPNILHRIKVGRVGREPFNLQPRRAIRKQLSRRGAMSRQAIPDQNHRTPQVAVDLTHEANEIRRAGVVIQQFVIQAQPQSPRGLRHGGDCRDSIPSIPRALQWRATSRRPDAPLQRLQQIPAFVEENQASLPFEALFLVAAKFRDASGRSPLRFVRGLAAPAFVDSSPTHAATAARNWDETPRRTVARSRRVQEARSNRPARNPNNECRAPMLRPIPYIGGRTTWALAPDVAGLATGCRVSMPSSIGTPRKRWNRRLQPHPSTTCPARTAWLQSYDGLRASQGFRLVSCRHYTKAARVSIN